MIDFIKISFKREDAKINLLEDIEFYTHFNEVTGEIKYSEGRYKNFEIICLADKIIIKGSLHRYYNNGEHNHNIFTYRDLAETLISLCNKFGINPFEAKIDSIEFGVNVLAPISPKLLIKSRLINYKGYPASRNMRYSGKGYLNSFDFYDYYIKFYDKSLQYGKRKDILRYEIGTKKMRFLKETGIQYLSDLFYLDSLRNLSKILLDTYEDFLIVDLISVKLLSVKAKETYLNGRNPKFWENLRPDALTYPLLSHDPEYKKQKQHYHRERNKFKNLIIKHDALRTKNILYELIKVSLSKLMCTDTKTRDIITAFLVQYDPNLSKIKGDLYTHYVATNIHKIKGQIHPLRNAGKGPYPEVEFIQVGLPETVDPIRLESVKKVLHDSYDVYYSDHRVMSKHTIQKLREECRRKDGVALTEAEFLDYAKLAEPTDLVPPF